MITPDGLFTWTPTEDEGPGVFMITVRVTDDGTGMLSDFETIEVTVGEVNEPPVLDAFEVDSSTSYWYISGHVSDEQIEMFGHVVRLGGLLEGVQLDLLPDGSFFYYTLMPPGTTISVEPSAASP